MDWLKQLEKEIMQAQAQIWKLKIEEQEHDTARAKAQRENAELVLSILRNKAREMRDEVLS